MPTHKITSVQFIRQHVLRMSIQEFAKAIGISGSVLSRYESAGVLPEKHHSIVRRLAARRKITLREEWFSEVPFNSTVPG